MRLQHGSLYFPSVLISGPVAHHDEEHGAAAPDDHDMLDVEDGGAPLHKHDLDHDHDGEEQEEAEAEEEEAAEAAEEGGEEEEEEEDDDGHLHQYYYYYNPTTMSEAEAAQQHPPPLPSSQSLADEEPLELVALSVLGTFHLPPPIIDDEPPPLPAAGPPAIVLPPADADQDIVVDVNVDVEDFHPVVVANPDHPVFVTNPNPGVLLPENPSVHDFLRYWRWLKSRGRLSDIKQFPVHEDSVVDTTCPSRVEYDDLLGDDYDIQGINWTHMQVDRSVARKCRVKTFRNYVNRSGSDTWKSSLPDELLYPSDHFYRFRSMDVRRDVRLLHFQLRNILGCHSRTRVFYPSHHTVRDVHTAQDIHTVRELDPTTGCVKDAMRFENDNDAAITTISAEESILMAGSFLGTYQYRHLEGDGTCANGRLTEHPSGITNHVQIYSSRGSNVPQAGFASNDGGFRVVDLERNQIISHTSYPYAINCTALCMDKRLRVMVGDLQKVLITEVDTGKILQALPGHRDYGFACDWSPDGLKIATGNQDKTIRIWDARKWSEPYSVMRAEMAGVRSLKFSPLGTRPTLVAAEEADFVNIIDARTFKSKQTMDIFGELTGIAYTNGGEEIIAMSSDPIRGGIMTLERCPTDIWQEHPTEREKRAPALAEDWFF